MFDLVLVVWCLTSSKEGASQLISMTVGMKRLLNEKIILSKFTRNESKEGISFPRPLRYKD